MEGRTIRRVIQGLCWKDQFDDRRRAYDEVDEGEYQEAG